MAKIISLLSLLLMLNLANLALAAPAQDTAAEAMNAVAVVDSLLSENLFQEAVSAARTFNEIYKDDFRWNSTFENRLAVSMLRAGQPAEALPLLENWVLNNPNEAQGHRNLGACLVALGRKGRALSEYQQVVELEPRNASARLEYGQVLMEFRILKDAGREILTAASLCGDCLEVQPALAQYYQAVNEPAKAVVPWRVIWNETGNLVARRNLLKALLDSGQDREALNLLLQSDYSALPRDELQQIVAVEARLGLSEQSLVFARLLEDPQQVSEIPENVILDPVFWGQVSNNLLQSGHDPEALAAVEKAISLEPGNVVYLNNRVVLLQKLGRDKEARAEWENVIKLDPSLKGSTN